MLTSLALVFLVGLALAALCQKLKLPRIIGMLATGILLGPCVLNVLDGSILSISADLRKLALVIILLKAGLSLDLGDLKKVGRPGSRNGRRCNGKGDSGLSCHDKVHVAHERGQEGACSRGKVLCPCAQCVRNAVLAAGEMLGE